ncbi:MAG TPA: GlsB/YeaQ/YmgE family stress response membrane protein [Stellaceae bacterium]
MSIIAWIILGLIAGFIASKIVNRTGEGVVVDIILGIVGAVVGGWIMSALGGEPVSGFNLYSILVAIGGAILVLAIAHAIRGRPTSSRL